MARHPWLSEKARHDSAAGATEALPASATQHLWMVHGVWYDLSSYVSRHPGGAFWLRETQGMDITDLVETHHLNMQPLQAVLDRHRVGPAKEGHQGFYDYVEGGLYPTLKRRVAAALAACGGSDATPHFRAQCFVVLVAHVALFLTTVATGSRLAAAASGLTISSLHGIGHNFLHQRDNWWMYACIVGGWNVHLNRVSHAISHHPMPNTEWDLEILGHEPWLFNMVDRPPNSRLVALYGPLLCASGHLLDIVFTWSKVVRGKQRLALEMLANPLQAALLVWGRGWAEGLGLFVAMFIVFGFIDSYAGYPLHHTAAAWTVGDPAHPRKRDLARHVIASTVDYDVGAMGTWQSMLCYELMPNHCLHHLFPTVDCSRFEAIRPVFEATLQEFGLRQKLIAQPHIYFGMWPAWLRGTAWDSRGTKKL